jgi:hypothetical protein
MERIARREQATRTYSHHGATVRMPAKRLAQRNFASQNSMKNEKWFL